MKLQGIYKIENKINGKVYIGQSSNMEIRKKALEEHYRPLIVDGIRKVLKGETTLEELNKKLLFF